jgi:hypothetical protein
MGQRSKLTNALEIEIEMMNFTAFLICACKELVLSTTRSLLVNHLGPVCRQERR